MACQGRPEFTASRSPAQTASASHAKRRGIHRSMPSAASTATDSRKAGMVYSGCRPMRTFTGSSRYRVLPAMVFSPSMARPVSTARAAKTACLRRHTNAPASARPSAPSPQYR